MRFSRHFKQCSFINQTCWWLSARLQYLQYVSNRDAVVLHCIKPSIHIVLISKETVRMICPDCRQSRACWWHGDLSYVKLSSPGKNDCHFAHDIFRCISWMKSVVFWFEFHWNMFLGIQFSITRHWLRKWLGAEQTISHYLNQCWPDSLTLICATGEMPFGYQ